MIDQSVMKSSNLVQCDLEKCYCANMNVFFSLLHSDEDTISQDMTNLFFISPLE